MPDIAQSWATEERRRHARFRQDLNVSYRIQGEDIEPVCGRVDDLSVSGALIVCHRDLAVDTRIEVTIARVSDDLSVSVPGAVRRCTPCSSRGDLHLLGIEFLGMTEDDQERLSSLATPMGRARPLKERRRHVRLSCDLPAWVKPSWFSWWRPVTTRNLGVGGQMVETEAPIQPGKRIKLRVKLPGQPALSLAATVAAAVDGADKGRSRLCLRFEDVPPKVRALIEDYIAEELRVRQGQRPTEDLVVHGRVRMLVDRVGMMFAVALLCAFVVQSTRGWLPLASLGRSVYDVKVRARGPRQTHPGILILGIDEDSFLKLAEWGHPFPTTAPVDMRVLANLKRWGASAACLCRHYQPQQDGELARAVGSMPDRVVWGFSRGTVPPLRQVPEPALQVFRWGFMNMYPDPDMSVRRACLAAWDQSSFALAAAEAYAGKELLPRSDKWQFRLVNYRGPVGTFPSVPYWQAAAGEISDAVLSRHDASDAKTLFEGKVVLIGPTSSAMGQTYPTPFSATTQRQSSVVEIQATLVDNLLAGDESHRPSRWADALFLFGPALIASVAFLALRPSMAAGILIVDLAFVIGFPIWIWAEYGIVLSHVAPGVTVILGACLAMVTRMTVVTREAQQALSEHNQLKARQEAQERSLAKARGIVEFLLPDLEDLPFADRLGVSASFNPMEKVGGDIFDVRQIAPDRVAVVFADVSGHGVSAALVASMVKSLGIFLHDHAGDPKLFLGHLNRNLCRTLPGDMFVALFYAVIDLEHQTLTYGNAGHQPLPVLIPGDGQAPRTLSEAGGLVAGAHEDFDYVSQTVEFSFGDTLFFCSDGVTDGRCREDTDVLLPEDLLALAGDQTLSTEQVIQEVGGWQLRTPKVDYPEDDETVLIVRRK